MPTKKIQMVTMNGRFYCRISLDDLQIYYDEKASFYQYGDKTWDDASKIDDLDAIRLLYGQEYASRSLDIVLADNPLLPQFVDECAPVCTRELRERLVMSYSSSLSSDTLKQILPNIGAALPSRKKAVVKDDGKLTSKDKELGITILTELKRRGFNQIDMVMLMSDALASEIGDGIKRQLFGAEEA